MAYERIAGPIGGKRGDVSAAIVAATLANIHSDGGRAFEIDDFMPEWSKSVKEVMAPEDIWSQVVAAHATLTAGSK
jgi:hypothetical protein